MTVRMTLKPQSLDAAMAPISWHSMKLDKIDIRILCELQKNGRISNVELAELINLSPSPCLMRVKRLQTEGFITGIPPRSTFPSSDKL